MLPPVFNVLFDGFAYGMLLFVLSVGLSVTLGMMNFVNLAHCSFAMLGGYVTVTLMSRLGWPFLATLPAELRLIGGLAVMCRVGTPHRATVDLDAVARDLAGVHVDLAALAVSATSGGQYTFAGDLELDVIDVSSDPVEALVAELGWPDVELSDLELNVVAHTWAHDTAAELDLVAVDESSGARLATAPGRLVASALGLVATTSGQLLLFSLLAVVTTVGLRAPLVARLRRAQDTGVGIENLIGEVATLADALAPGAVGKAELRGTVWTVRSEHGDPLPAGRRCRVARVEGLVLWVRPE